MLDWLFGRKKQEPEPQKKQKPSAEQEAEDKWKYDFIVQFLSGPVWKTSILDFVDYHCVVFDTEQQNKFEYTTLHNKFKELVATLFDGMMQEVGLDDQKLAELLEKGFDSKHRKIFNQLLLADDFLKFKQLMINRNKTLQAEAVKALQQSQGHHQVQKKKEKRVVNQQQILRQSKLAEEQRLRKLQQQEEEQLRKAIQLSRIQTQEQNLIKKLEQKVAKSQIKKEPQVQVKQQPPKVVEPVVQVPKVQEPKVVQPVPPPPPVQQPQPSQQKPKKNLPSLQPLPPLKNQRRLEQSPVVQQKKEEIKQEASVVQEKQQAPKVEVQSQQDRKKRLLQQRQRMRRKKEEQRKKEMAEDQKKPVQTIVLQEDGIHETNIPVVEDKKVSMTQIERRRELMKKIKNRIVDDF